MRRITKHRRRRGRRSTDKGRWAKRYEARGGELAFTGAKWSLSSPAKPRKIRRAS